MWLGVYMCNNGATMKEKFCEESWQGGINLAATSHLLILQGILFLSNSSHFFKKLDKVAICLNLNFFG